MFFKNKRLLSATPYVGIPMLLIVVQLLTLSMLAVGGHASPTVTVYDNADVLAQSEETVLLETRHAIEKRFVLDFFKSFMTLIENAAESADSKVRSLGNNVHRKTEMIIGKDGQPIEIPENHEIRFDLIRV